MQYSAFNFILPPLIVVESNRGACRVYGVVHGLCFMCAITIQVRPELTSAMTLNSEISPRLGCGINSSQRDNCSVRFTVAVVRLSYALTQRVVNANELTLLGSQRRPAGQPICARVCGYAIPLHVNYNKSNSFPRIEYRPPKTDKCTIRTKERCLRTDICTIRTRVRCLRTVRTVKDPATPSSWDVEMR